MNQDWTKFINASVNKHFDLLRQSKLLLIEGVKPPPSQAEWAELRINGPDYFQPLKGQFIVNLSVDIMCNVATTGLNGYSIHQLVGIFQQACVNMQVYKFSGDPSALDTNLPFFCLTRIEDVKTLQWGVIRKDVDVYCTSVAAAYKGEFLWP